jgi:hypothetical protein
MNGQNYTISVLCLVGRKSIATFGNQMKINARFGHDKGNGQEKSRIIRIQAGIFTESVLEAAV